MKAALFGLIACEVLLGVGDAAAPLGSVDGLILANAARAGLPPGLVRAVIAAESEFRPGAVSSRGARGLMQVMPDTAEGLGVPAGGLGEPGPNIRAGTAYLASLYGIARVRYRLKAERLGDAPTWVQRRVLAAYNGGPNLLFSERWPGQTRRFVSRVSRLAGLREPEPRPAAAVRPRVSGL